MRYRVTVDITVARESGPFATRDEIGEQIVEAIEAADYGEWEGENGGIYISDSWEVEIGPG